MSQHVLSTLTPTGWSAQILPDNLKLSSWWTNIAERNERIGREMDPDRIKWALQPCCKNYEFHWSSILRTGKYWTTKCYIRNKSLISKQIQMGINQSHVILSF